MGLPLTQAAAQNGKADRPPEIEINRTPVGGPPSGGFQRGVERVEIPALRTQTSRTFDTGYGPMETEVFVGSIHHRVGDRWEPIDNTLDPTGAGYENRANRYRVRLPKVLGAAPVRFELGTDFVTLDLQGASGRPAVAQKNAATYADALQGVDVHYEALSDSLKEDLVLASADSTAAFTWRMHTSPSLTPRATEAGGIDFVGGDGTVVMRIPAPVIYDADGPVDGLAPAHAFELVRGNGFDELSLTVDEQWLASPDREFPVTVDPTLDASGPGSRDCYIDSSQPDNVNCGQSALYVGKYGGAKLRALLRFDVGAVPNNAQVLNGTLGLYHEGATQTVTNKVAVRPLTRSFVNTEPTWNKSALFTWWDQPGGDFNNNNGFVKTNVDDRLEWKYWYITNIVRNWVVKGAAENHGVIVKVDNDASTDPNDQPVDQRLSFSSMESPNNPQPRLTILWDHATGSLPSYTTEDKQLTERRDQKINVASGNLLIKETDFKIKGTGLDLVMERYYNSRGPGERPSTGSQLGTGWTLTNSPDIGLKLFHDEVSGAPGKGAPPPGAPPGSAVFFGPSGYRVPFVRESTNGPFRRPAGLNAKLENVGGQWVLTFRETEERYVFSEGGILNEHRDKNFNRINFFYDTNDPNRITSIRDTQGRVTTFTYNTNGMLTEIKDPANRTHKYGYTHPSDPKLLTTYTDPAGFVTTYAYDFNKRLESISNPEQHQTVYSYNSAGKVARVLYVTQRTSPPTGHAVSVDYYSSYDSTRCPERAPEVPRAQLELATTVTDPRANTTTYCYNAGGEVGLIKDAAGNTTHKKYDSLGNVTNLIDARGKEFIFDYDSGGSLTQTLGVATGTSTPKRSTKIEYNDPNHPGMATLITDPQGNKTHYEYDSRGNITATTLAHGTTDAVTFRYTYDPMTGNLTRVARPPEPDPLDSGGAETQGNDILFQYDAAGNLLGINYPQIRWWPTLYAVPSQAGDIGYRYDGLSRVLDVTDGHGRMTKPEYDVLDQVWRVQYTHLSNVSTILYTHDKVGNIVSRVDYAQNTNSATQSTYRYNVLNQLFEEVQPEGTSGYTYDPAGNLKTITKAGGTTTFDYDKVNLVSKVTYPGGQFTEFEYWPTHQRKLVKYPNGTQVQTGYNHNGDVSTITATNGNTPFVNLEYVYERNVGGQNSDQALVSKMIDHRTSETTAYTYDRLNRLTEATRTTSNGSVVDRYAYAFDRNSNVTRATKWVGTTKESEVEFTHGNFNELTRCRRVVGTTGCHDAASPNTIDYYYDGSGNVSQGFDSSTQSSVDVGFTYDVRNHTSYIQKANKLFSFAYVDATQAERKSKALPNGATVTSEFDLLGIERERASGDLIQYLRDNEGEVHGQKVNSGPTARYYVRDRLGSVVAITDQTGAVAKRYHYDPYGNHTTTGSDDVYQPWRWAKGYFDQETGLYKMGERYYDPLLHRFTQVDPVKGNVKDPMTFNPYLYGAGDPINNSDPTGRCSEEQAETYILTGAGLISLGLSLLSPVTGVAAITALSLDALATGYGVGEIIAGLDEC